MSKDRLTKKQLQSDELKHALVGARDYVATHQGQTKKWTAIAAGAAIVIGATWFGIDQHQKTLGARLSNAVALFDAPLVTQGTAAPGQRVFKDAAERQAAVKKELQDLASDSPSSKSGRAAALLLVSMEGPTAVSGARVDAIKAFVSSDPGSVAGGIAAVSLLDAQAAAGRTTEAIDTAKKYLESSSSPLPKDVLIFTLARLYEKSGKPVEARTFYQRIVTDFPDSPMRFEAQQKAQAL